ncbi:MAG: sigma-70 family RNA polymerase sigma factor [Chloroflexi bacterium]|nr:MAG: sigma-70 family RNA polymerase sigma factor [Chloroflexota bacterium]
MWTRPESDEALVKRMMPNNSNAADRADAWSEWQLSRGREAVLKFIRLVNNTLEPDEDILQEALLTAYTEVERGRYERREGVPFTAYVKGIARNKIREARRRERGTVPLDAAGMLCGDALTRSLEAAFERKEQQRALQAGLARLPPARRQVLEQFMHGVSTTEIALRLEMNEALVRQHKCRGVRSLKKMGILSWTGIE